MEDSESDGNSFKKGLFKTREIKRKVNTTDLDGDTVILDSNNPHWWITGTNSEFDGTSQRDDAL